ncbi:MAG: glycosyltransferase family 4 protein [Deltaproteobacteria bacterium]|jgi:Fuc2NAc and GlcNAc transferase|nr:glycosyltransferase family 4 protein [Deltaproteobacteria bacterium]
MKEYLLFLNQTYIVEFINYFGYFFICVVTLFFIIKISHKIGLVDIPNNRSFHLKPTPSGGGIAIVLIILLSNYKYIEICPEFFIGGFLIAILGLADDIKPLPVLPRLISQIIVVFGIIYFLPTNQPIIGIPIQIIKVALFLAGVWFINIYNFMDGIDGLAGGYGNAASVGFLYCIQGNLITVENWNIEIYHQIIYLTIAFLIFNWSPAKIFMGDTGSTFLGFTFFSLGARALIFGNYIIYSFLIIMSFFWIDATITLVRRFLRGEKIFKAHKEHAFHKATELFGHWKVAAFIILTTIFWLNPMAKYTINNVSNAPWLTILAVLPVLFVIVLFNPGSPKESQYWIVKYLKLKK